MAVAWDRTALWLKRNGRQTIMMILILVSAYVVYRVIIQSVWPHIVGSDDFVMTADKIELSPPVPRWIRTDLRAEAFKNPDLKKRHSLMDDELVDKIKSGFAIQPWVAEVVRVEKQSPAKVIVHLKYRRPACFVDSSAGYYPVDAQGFLLPAGDFTPAERREYPRLDVDSKPTAPVGRLWEDKKIRGGAQVANALSDVWNRWQLSRLSLGIPHPDGCPTYYIFTLDGNRIFWGPGDDQKSTIVVKLTTEQKLARLANYLLKHKSFKPLAQTTILDVYRLPDP